MKELLGLCSGRFSDSEDNKTLNNTETQNNTKGHKKSLRFDTQSKQFNMNELLGLCSGKFSDDDDDNEVEDDVLKRQEKDSEIGEEEDKSDGDENGLKMDEMSANEEESDPEEMILKRKYGKTYEAKKRYMYATNLQPVYCSFSSWT